MKAISDLGVVIVNYKTPELVLKCIKSLFQYKIAINSNIVVVDNCSMDNSVDILRNSLPDNIALVVADENCGFGAGVNIGVNALNNEYLLILNPDTYFVDDSIKDAITKLKDAPEIGIIGLDLFYPAGERQYSARRFYTLFDIILRRTKLKNMSIFSGRLELHVMNSEWCGEDAFEADWVMGTGFIIRRSVFEAINGMDDSFFLYMEDVDLCLRVWKAGYKVISIPGVKLIHDHQRSSSTGLFNFAVRSHLKSLFLFWRRYRIPLYKIPKINEL